MSFPRSPPQSPDDWKSRGMMSKTFSTSSRSTNPNSRSASMASSSSRPYNNINYESSARTYYAELRKYLINFLAKEAAEGVHPQRASARQKLSRLSNLQFHELAMDVYDELMRRNLNDKFVPFLAVREEFHPKRNQARQKLATLPESRFTDLASDVYYELTRRYPHIMDADDTNRPPMPPIPTTSISSPIPRNPMGNEQQQQQQQQPASQATTIVPMKGTINVEPVSSKDSSDDDNDDDNDHDHDHNHTQFSENSPVGKYTYSAQQQHQHLRNKNTDNNSTGYQSKQSTISSSPSYYQQQHHNNTNNNNGYGKQDGDSLDSLMADLGNMVHTRSEDSDNNASTNAYTKKLVGVDEYEYQIATMTERIQMLEQENQDLMARKMSRDDTDGRNNEKMHKLRNDYNRLDEQYRSLERNHRDQQEMVHDVKQETSQLMNELEKLSRENDKFRDEKEQADFKNRQLLQEIQEWQTKYQKLQIELRNANGSTEHEKSVPNQNIIKESFLQPTRTGVIPYDSIVSYQAAIEDLLQRSRSKSPSDIFSSMKILVVTCKAITEDVERYETKGALTLDKQTKLQSLKGPFSNGLTQLVTAAKSHVNSMGISPIGLLDVAACNLTCAVVDLVKLVGMAPSPSSSSSSSSPSSSASSISSALSPTTPTTTRNTDHHHYHTGKKNTISDSGKKLIPSMTPIQLAEYLKKETDQIVSNIQNLLSSLRSAQKIGDVYGIITTIVDVVTTVTDVSKSTFSLTTTDLRYRQQGEVVLSDLQQCPKRDLAKESYEIAKFIKELIGLCES
ncbi:hypothetical protein BCR42DRAFT_408716 [Absidia repens]|uniref:GIT Spa2 homology (SHD) domain-containing protein n=1 Tax=Absidia repens TaxID=90262 RepID=A0A1X2IQ82_9FUNG|nr:hypothetical protein BCR42DRAFT_408716 [Absidia repens]